MRIVLHEFRIETLKSPQIHLCPFRSIAQPRKYLIPRFLVVVLAKGLLVRHP